jgi:hypothetical protein
MQLRYENRTTDDPTEADVRAAIPDRAPNVNWVLVLIRNDDDMLEVEGEADGTYAVTHIDGERWHEATAPLNASDVRDLFAFYRVNDPRWRERTTWSSWDPQESLSKVAPAASAGPPRWLFVLYAIVIGVFVVQIFSLLFDIPLPLPSPRSAFTWPAITLPPALDSVAARIILIFFLVCVALFGIAAVVKAIEVRRAQNWASIQGKVVASGVGTERIADATDSLPRLRKVPKITFEYAVNGKTHRGSRVSFAERIPDAEVSGIVARYPVGKAVEVFYDPVRPSRAVLERSPPTGIARGCLGMFVVGLIGVVIAMWVVTSAPSLIQAALPHSHPWIMMSTATVGVLLLAIFVAVWRRSRAAQRWPHVVGQVISSKVEVYESTARRRYVPRVRYNYKVAGRAFESESIYLDAEVAGSRGYAEKIAGRYPAGSLVTVHYDPADPSLCALDRSPGLTWLLLGIGLLLMGVAVLASGVTW